MLGRQRPVSLRSTAPTTATPRSRRCCIYANDPYVTGNRGCDDGNHPNGPSDGALRAA